MSLLVETLFRLACVECVCLLYVMVLLLVMCFLFFLSFFGRGGWRGDVKDNCSVAVACPF